MSCRSLFTGWASVVTAAWVASYAVPALGANAPTAASARLLVLDSGAPALHALDATTGRTSKTVALTGRPLFLAAAPDGSRIFVFDRGPGKEHSRSWIPFGPASLTIVDGARMRVIGQVELGWGLSLEHRPFVSPDGRRLAVLCPGHDAKKVQDRREAEIVVVDATAATLAGRIALDRAPVAWFAGMNGGHAYALVPGSDGKKAPATASLVAVDLASATASGRLELAGRITEAVPSPDGRLAYVLDRGDPSSKPNKNVNGQLNVVSLASLSQRAVLDAGSDPHSLALEKASQALLLLANSTPAKGVDQKGELRVVRGEKLDSVIPLASTPLFMRRSEDGRQLYAVGLDGLNVLSLPNLAPLREMHIEGAGINWTSDARTGPPNDLATTPDGQRALVTYESSGKLLILNLTTGQKIASATTGRKGVKLLQMAAVTAMNASSYYAARQAAIAAHQSFFVYAVYGIRGPSTAMAVRADGRYAYALNTLTDDVTVVDTADGKVVTKLAAGGRELASLPGGHRLALISDSALRLLDTHANAVATTWELPGLLGVDLTPDGKTAVAVAEQSLVFFDPATGGLTARNDSFACNSDWLFLARRPPARTDGR